MSCIGLGYFIPRKAWQFWTLAHLVMTMKPKKPHHFSMIFCKGLKSPISLIHISVNFIFFLFTVLSNLSSCAQQSKALEFGERFIARIKQGEWTPLPQDVLHDRPMNPKDKVLELRIQLYAESWLTEKMENYCLNHLHGVWLPDLT